MAPIITQIDVSAYTVPTDFPESDGTFDWDSTTMVLVEAKAGGESGIGYTYGDLAAARIIDRTLSPIVIGRNAFDIPDLWADMIREVRNIGRPGIASMAIAAVDSALWDLKARLLGLPLVHLLGAARRGITTYGSGGFTSYSTEQLQTQLGNWAQAGLRSVKMKVGREPAKDPDRVRAARDAIGSVELFVDANGAYDRKQALRFAGIFADLGVTWFEEPVSSDDLTSLRLIRDYAPPPIRVAAGEYGFDSYYFLKLLEFGAVDVLQADATRCAGITGFLKAAEIADAYELPLSAHTAPAIHLHACCSIQRALNVEYYHDHVRIENMLFDGVAQPVNGVLYPDVSRPGNGLQLKRSDALHFAA